MSLIAANLPQKIKTYTSKGGASSATNKRFYLAANQGGMSSLSRESSMTYEVGYAQLSQKIQNIQKTGGKIIIVTEIV